MPSEKRAEEAVGKVAIFAQIKPSDKNMHSKNLDSEYAAFRRKRNQERAQRMVENLEVRLK